MNHNKEIEEIVKKFQRETKNVNTNVYNVLIEALTAYGDKREKEVTKIIEDTMEEAHGGGNWKRILIQAIDKARNTT